MANLAARIALAAENCAEKERLVADLAGHADVTAAVELRNGPSAAIALLAMTEAQTKALALYDRTRTELAAAQAAHASLLAAQQQQQAANEASAAANRRQRPALDYFDQLDKVTASKPLNESKKRLERGYTAFENLVDAALDVAEADPDGLPAKVQKLKETVTDGRSENQAMAKELATAAHFGWAVVDALKQPGCVESEEEAKRIKEAQRTVKLQAEAKPGPYSHAAPGNRGGGGRHGAGGNWQKKKF